MSEALLDRIDVAIPCTVPWESMTGTERIRFCTLRSKNVFNISEMGREAAEALIAAKQGQLCVRFYRRADGTVMTADCGRGTVNWKGRILGAAAFAVALLLSMIGWMFATERRDDHYNSWMRQTEPFATVLEWIDPAPRLIVGEMMPPPAPPPPNPPDSQ